MITFLPGSLFKVSEVSASWNMLPSHVLISGFSEHAVGPQRVRGEERSLTAATWRSKSKYLVRVKHPRSYNVMESAHYL